MHINNKIRLCALHAPKCYGFYNKVYFMRYNWSASSVCIAAVLTSVPALSANETSGVLLDNDITEIIVTGRNIGQIGTVAAGSSGTVGYDDFKNRPITRVGEILEVVPGLVATQHSGTGKANQYFLRGFNLDHGTDFSTSIDGVQVNLRSHGHGQGYTDLNFIIPEIVERVDFRKGTYHADAGDFTTAGDARIKTYDSLDRGFLDVSIGEFGFRRAVAAASFDVNGSTTLLTAVEGHTYHSPFDLNEDLEKLNAFAKLSGGNDELKWRIAFSAYDASWRATDQIPERAVESGLIGRFGFIDPDLGGNTTRYGLTANLQTAASEITAYFIDYDFNLFSNFTYFLNDPVRGDEFEQFDNRQIFGIKSSRHWHFDTAFPVSLIVGQDFRYDDIAAVGLYGTEGRARHTLVRDDAVEELSLALYGKFLLKPLPDLRIEVGLRGDSYHVDVDATRAVNSGEEKDAILSPSFSVAWRVSNRVELYANYGENFHSNDARGATISIDPVNGESVDTVPLLVKARGAELGARYENSDFKASVVGFWLNLGSELVFVGDAGTTEANDGTSRFGLEASVFWQAAPWINMFSSFGTTNARFRGDLGGNDHIPNAVVTVFSAGLELTPIEEFTSTLLLRHFGKAPLIEDGSIFSKSTTSVNWGSYYIVGPMKLGFEVLNLLNSSDSDISYLFETRLPNEAVGQEGLQTHPLEPRQIRASVRYSF